MVFCVFCDDSWWFVVIHGGLWWFVVVQCISVSLKNRCCLSDVSVATGVVVCGGLWWFTTLMPPGVKIE